MPSSSIHLLEVDHKFDSKLSRNQSEKGNVIIISKVKGNELLWRNVLAIHETKIMKQNFMYIVRKKNWKHIYHSVRGFTGLFCVMSLNIRNAILLRCDCNRNHFFFLWERSNYTMWFSNATLWWSCWYKERFQNIYRSMEQHKEYKGLQSFNLSHFIIQLHFSSFLWSFLEIDGIVAS